MPSAERIDIEYQITVRADADFVTGLGSPHAAAEPQLPPIEDFLDTRSEHVEGRSVDTFDNRRQLESLQYEDELPPVEHFIDPLPEVAAFAADSNQPPSSFERTVAAEQASVNGGASEVAEAGGWLETDWQQFDWRSVASLGESDSANVEASNAWATTNWEPRHPRAGARRESAADAIARALDEIAQRIRSGDLALPSLSVPPDPATIAATLAALLGVRR